MVTYNHERFIAQAIDSVLMQKTDFDYELVIGEDCSKDKTREIVIDYQKKHPDKIKLLLPESNLGAAFNFVQTLKSCRGEYIALLEGDDYWTNPLKLQKQVDFLETHADCVICFHTVNFFYEDTEKKSYSSPEAGQKEISTIDDLFKKHNFLATCSTMLRNRLFDEFPKWYFLAPMGDYYLYLLYAQYGNIGYINEVMAAYRKHEGGTWSTATNKENIIKTITNIIEYHIIFNAYTNYRYKKQIKNCISHFFIEQIKEYQKTEDTENLKSVLKKFKNEFSLVGFIRAIILLNHPKIYKYIVYLVKPFKKKI